MEHSHQVEVDATKLTDHFHKISELIEDKRIDPDTVAHVKKALHAAQQWADDHVEEGLTRDSLLDIMDELELQLLDY